jgi:hypothetical protein
MFFFKVLKAKNRGTKTKTPLKIFIDKWYRVSTDVVYIRNKLY